MKKNIEVYNSIDDLASAVGLTKVEVALIREKKRIIAKLKQAREAQGLTQAQVAKLVHTKQPAIARMESGMVSEVSLDFLFNVAWVLKVRISVGPSKAA